MLLGLALRCLPGAMALFLKGQDVEAELTEATKSWTVEAELHPSRTDADGRIVAIEQIVRNRAHAAARRGNRS